jgi:non-ribosomal peptide synthase protein (TIGR01720 family)
VAEDLDLVRTVGWFTSIHPVSVELGDARQPEEIVERVSRRLGKLTRNGLDYGLARFLRGDRSLERTLRRLQAEVKLNYLGQLDQGNLAADLFELLDGSVAASRSPRGRRSHTFDLTAAVTGGRFRLDWTYSAALHGEGTVRGLAAGFCGFLQAFLKETTCPGGRAETLGPLGMRPAELEALLGEFEFEEE